MPIIDPNNDEAIKTRNVFSSPIQKPIIAIILTSPIPIPSFLRTRRYIFDVSRRMPPLINPPNKLSTSEILKTEKENCAARIPSIHKL